MMVYRRPPTVSEWVGMIVALCGLVGTLLYHAWLSAQAFQRMQDDLHTLMQRVDHLERHL